MYKNVRIKICNDNNNNLISLLTGTLWDEAAPSHSWLQAHTGISPWWVEVPEMGVKNPFSAAFPSCGCKSLDLSLFPWNFSLLALECSVWDFIQDEIGQRKWRCSQCNPGSRQHKKNFLASFFCLGFFVGKDLNPPPHKEPKNPKITGFKPKKGWGSVIIAAFFSCKEVLKFSGFLGKITWKRRENRAGIFHWS